MRTCPYDFTVDLYKDDNIQSPVVVCKGFKVFPSEAVCAGRVVDNKCLVEVKLSKFTGERGPGVSAGCRMDYMHATRSDREKLFQWPVLAA